MFSMDLLNTKLESHWIFLLKKKKLVFKFTYLAALGLGCGMRDLELCYVNFESWYVGSSSLARD